MPTIKLDHPTDPRYLMVPPGLLPDTITAEEAYAGVFGKLLLFAPEPHMVYAQPGGPGTAWVRPEGATGGAGG